MSHDWNHSMIEQLSPDQQRTYDAIFQHPISNNLERREVRSMFEALGQVEDEHNGNIKIDRNGHTLVLHPAHASHPAGVDEVMQLRHFLESSGVADEPKSPSSIHIFIVIEPKQVLIYQSEVSGTIPQRVTPHATHRNPRHVHHAQEHDGRQSRPLDSDYFKTIVDDLMLGDEILIFGTGDGSKKVMETLLKDLHDHHKGIFDRVIGSLMVGGHDVTEETLLERAREFYATRTDHRLQSAAH